MIYTKSKCLMGFFSLLTIFMIFSMFKICFTRNLFKVWSRKGFFPLFLEKERNTCIQESAFNLSKVTKGIYNVTTEFYFK